MGYKEEGGRGGYCSRSRVASCNHTIAWVGAKVEGLTPPLLLLSSSLLRRFSFLKYYPSSEPPFPSRHLLPLLLLLRLATSPFPSRRLRHPRRCRRRGTPHHKCRLRTERFVAIMHADARNIREMNVIATRTALQVSLPDKVALKPRFPSTLQHAVPRDLAHVRRCQFPQLRCLHRLYFLLSH